MDVRVRYAEEPDCPALAVLSDELGYPISAERMAERLAAVVDGGRGAVLVAEEGLSGVVGWISVVVLETLTEQRRAHVTGLIVSKTSQSRGVGRQLLTAAEEWALRAGCEEVVVRSRVSRERAHGFYLDRGYELVKTQHLFRRTLGD